MKMTELTAVAVQYDTLLCRYARMITKSQHAAEKIVMEVFEEYYDSKVQMHGKILRAWLKGRVRRKSVEMLQKQAWASTSHNNN
jgi:DNA-directed RNA polymerase specialized sigma24 family protein